VLFAIDNIALTWWPFDDALGMKTAPLENERLKEREKRSTNVTFISKTK